MKDAWEERFTAIERVAGEPYGVRPQVKRSTLCSRLGLLLTEHQFSRQGIRRVLKRGGFYDFRNHISFVPGMGTLSAELHSLHELAHGFVHDKNPGFKFVPEGDFVTSISALFAMNAVDEGMAYHLAFEAQKALGRDGEHTTRMRLRLLHFGERGEDDEVPFEEMEEYLERTGSESQDLLEAVVKKCSPRNKLRFIDFVRRQGYYLGYHYVEKSLAEGATPVGIILNPPMTEAALLEPINRHYGLIHRIS